MDFYDRLQRGKTFPLQGTQQVLARTYRALHQRMSEKYNCSQAYTQLETINKIVDPQSDEESQNKKPLLDKIMLNDLKFMEDQEYMEQRYEENFKQQLVDLFEYYKYYLQDPAIYFRQHYDVMHRYYERRKGHVYNELKKILTLSQVQDGKQNKNQESFLFQSEFDSPNKKNKKKKEKQPDSGLANILAEITMNRTLSKSNQFDESVQFDDLKTRLIKVYGPPSAKSMQTIDSIYNFNKIGQDHLPLKNQQKFYHGGQASVKKQFGEIVANSFKKKNNCHPSNMSTRFMESTNISNSQRCPHTSLNDQQFPIPISNQQITQVPKRGSRKRSGRRYKSTGNSQDASELKIQVSQQSLVKCIKNIPTKKSKLRRKSSDLLFNNYLDGNHRKESEKLRPLLNTETYESRHEEPQYNLTGKNASLPKKRKHSAKVKSTEFNMANFDPNIMGLGMEPYLQGTIAKFKRKIQQQKREILQQKKVQTIIPQKSSALLKAGNNFRDTHANFSQHCQAKKKQGQKNRLKPQSTITNIYKN